jgi:peptidylprolyl isomerase
MIAKCGDTVRIHYTGRLTDGTEFDSSAGREPLQFKLGEGEVIRGFDDAVSGMRVGDAKTVTIACEDAYGAHRADLLVNFERDDLPADLELDIGSRLDMRGQQGQPYSVVVVEANDVRVVVDANHELAGHDLTFDLTLVSIVTR